MNKNMRWPCPKLGGIPQLMATSEIAWWFQPLLDHHRADLDCRSTRVMSLAHCSAFCDVGGPRVEGRTLTVVLALCWSLEFSSTQMESTYIFVGALWNQCNWLCWWFGTAYCVVRILPSIRSIHLSIYPSIYIYIYLVGGLTHFLWLSIYWEFHHPNWRTPSFVRGVGLKPPTRFTRGYIPLSGL